MKRRAVLSLYDKTNLIDFARGLADLGWELIASGGTGRMLREAGLEALDVSTVTGTPEMLDGRVKTLHPAIHAGILARESAADRAELASQGYSPIDLVASNLYPFQQTVSRPDVSLAEAVEQIDIGGVTLLRAAAKNFERVTVLSDPADYEAVLAELRNDGVVSLATRRRLALKAFTHTRDYDMAIVSYLEGLEGGGGTGSPTGKADSGPPEQLALNLVQSQILRYGENPHQEAALYSATAGAGPLGGRLLQGKALSYNNLLDLDAAWNAAENFSDPAVVFVKHLTPCGIARASTSAAAFPLALDSDPVSAFGGVIAVNRPVDASFVAAVRAANLFVEAVIAPDFSEEATTWFGEKKKNCRLVMVDPNEGRDRYFELRSIRGGILAQGVDPGDPADTRWRVVSRRQPTELEWRAVRFAWLAVQHVKSNAILFAQAGDDYEATVGIGGGLPSRVDAVRLAAAKAGDKAGGAVMASDAFFPFPDGVEAAAEVGITAVIEPGGSVRDEEVINAADRLGLALVFTGVRHFKH